MNSATESQPQVCRHGLAGKQPRGNPGHSLSTRRRPLSNCCNTAAQMSRTARPAFNAIGAAAQATALTGDHSPEPFLGNHLDSDS
jgi:hypothetical protein